MMTTETLVDTGMVPDWLVRAGIRKNCAARLREQQSDGPTGEVSRRAALEAALRRSPVAVSTELANAQHYEVPAAFFQLVLGPQLKYSCGFWPPGVTTLAEAETRMLQLTIERAQLHDGPSILELGCGWGSLSLLMAERLPSSAILAVSNSASQRAFILDQATQRGLRNIDVVTADINRFEPRERFDRIVSVEMLEHVRNYEALFSRLNRWLADDGRLFVHIFAHHRFAYPFETRDDSDWMARHFFSGGMMPSEALFTANAWLDNMDRRRDAVDAVLAATYGARDVRRWRARWRVFFMACAEMFGYRNGTEWVVSHYRFRKRV